MCWKAIQVQVIIFQSQLMKKKKKSNYDLEDFLSFHWTNISSMNKSVSDNLHRIIHLI
jgi:hypothetical protein